MSREISEVKGYEYCTSAIKLESSARSVYLEMGEKLHRIRTERLYEPHWSSWTEFCMEFKDLSFSSISKMISVHEVFVLGFKFSPAYLAEVGGWTKLYALTNLVKSKKDAEEWFDKSKTLTLVDLTRELKEAKTGIEMRTCAHLDTYTIKICRSCGERTQEVQQ